MTPKTADNWRAILTALRAGQALAAAVMREAPLTYERFVELRESVRGVPA